MELIFIKSFFDTILSILDIQAKKYRIFLDIYV